MKYKAVGKSAKEIVGRDCKSFTIEIWLDSNRTKQFCYLKGMNKLAGTTVIVETDTHYDFVGAGYKWLKEWLKDIKPITLRAEFDAELSKKGIDIITEQDWWCNYANFLEKKLEKKKNM